MTLDEGGTPLLRSRSYGARRLWLKDETRNPTGSHKDRALALGINHALTVGAGVSAVVSAGSTGLSHAAYAARAGLTHLALMSADTPVERACPVFALGTKIVMVDAPIDLTIETLEAIAPEIGVYVTSTTRRSNPYQSEAGKTIAYELHEQLGEVPDWLVVPTGGGGTIAAIWRGYQDLRALGLVKRVPRLLAVVPRSYNLIERVFAEGVADEDAFAAMARHDVDPSSLAKLAHIVPPDGLEAVQAIRASDGWAVAVTDDEAFAGQRRIAETEGIYAEPSSGTIIPAIDALIARGRLAADASVVALLCGSGFRETFVSMKQLPWQVRPARIADLRDVISQVMSGSGDAGGASAAAP